MVNRIFIILCCVALFQVLVPRRGFSTGPKSAEDAVVIPRNVWIKGWLHTYKSLEVGGEFNFKSSANTREAGGGPKVSADILDYYSAGGTSITLHMEIKYVESYTRVTSDQATQKTKTKVFQWNYGKIVLDQIHGHMLKGRWPQPYISGGFQYVDLRGTTNGQVSTAYYWTPSWGAGIVYELPSKLKFDVNYNANIQGGTRRISTVFFGLTYPLFASK